MSSPRGIPAVGGRVSGQRPSSEPLTPFPSPAAPVAWVGTAGRTSGEGNRGPSFSPGAARAASLLFSQEVVRSAVPGRVDTACHTSVGGLKVAGNVAGIRSGPCLPPAQAEAAKFGPILSSCPYLAFQVIRLRHKGGCGPLEATRPLQRERMVSARWGTPGRRTPRCCPLGWGHGAGTSVPVLGPERWSPGREAGPWAPVLPGMF